MARELLLLCTWFYQKTVGHAAFSPGLLVFWAAVVLILGFVPVSVSVVSRERAEGSFFSRPGPDLSPLSETLTALTDREREIYQYLKEGLTLSQIARTCTIEYGTVKTHARHIYRKLSVNTREELP